VTDHSSAIRTEFSRPASEIVKGYQELPTTALSDFLLLDNVMRHAIHPLWGPPPRIAGPAFTVRTAKHDNLMMHAAIYLAAPGDVIVVEAGDEEMAVAGGNVCAIAQRRGVAGFIIDGVIRDVGESRDRGFPLFARGRSPIPAGKKGPGHINAPIRCGGVVVSPGDMVVADEEGIVVVPATRAAEILAKATAKAAADAATSLDDWEKKHRAGVDSALKAGGFRR
jgi:4-hydroxy-4-methyl-2-oxoglutarate aldolase